MRCRWAFFRVWLIYIYVCVSSLAKKEIFWCELNVVLGIAGVQGL
jgi:hypothetical protein